MKRTLEVIRWIVISAVAVMTIIAVGNFIQEKRDARSFASYDFPETLVINNSTRYDKADTIALYLAHHILHLDTINLIIAYLPESVGPKEEELYAIIQPLPFKKNQFLILLDRDDMSPRKLKKAFCHEFVHADQYLSGDLVVYPLFAIWKGEDVYFGETPYDKRPFEMDAFFRQNKYLRKLNKVLY